MFAPLNSEEIVVFLLPVSIPSLRISVHLFCGSAITFASSPFLKAATVFLSKIELI